MRAHSAAQRAKKTPGVVSPQGPKGALQKRLRESFSRPRAGSRHGEDQFDGEIEADVDAGGGFFSFTSGDRALSASEISGTNAPPFPPDSHYTGEAPKGNLRRQEREQGVDDKTLRKLKPWLKQRQCLDEDASQQDHEERGDSQNDAPPPGKAKPFFPDGGGNSPNQPRAQRKSSKDKHHRPRRPPTGLEEIQISRSASE